MIIIDSLEYMFIIYDFKFKFCFYIHPFILFLSMSKSLVLLIVIAIIPLALVVDVPIANNPPIMSYKAHLSTPTQVTTDVANMNIYMLPHVQINYNSIVFGASRLELGGLENNIEKPFSSWEIKLVNRSNMLGFELKVEESMITWKIEVSYLIIDRTRAEIFPVVESLKMSQKNFIKKTDSSYLLTFIHNKQISSKENPEQQQIIVITFLRGFTLNQGQNRKGKAKINIKDATSSDQMIQFSNQIDGIKSYQITILVINKASLLKAHYYISNIPGSALPSGYHRIDTLSLLKSLELPFIGNMELNVDAMMDQSSRQLELFQIKCQKNTRFDDLTGQCKIIDDSQMQLVQVKQERVLDSSSCSPCYSTVTCPSTLIGATLCYNVNGVVKVKTCSVGYYTLTTLAKSCTSCSVITNCIQCSLSYTTNLLTCLACSSGYAAKNSSCVACLFGCATCAYNYDGVINCLTCLSTFTKMTSGYISTCNCGAGKYALTTPLPGSCASCNSICRTCTSSTVCQSCITGYYISGSSCFACMKVCKTCTTSSTCATCYTSSILDSSSVCTCSAELFFQTSTKSCQLCSTLFSNCETCGYNGAYTPVNPPPIICTQAKLGYYLDSGTGAILNCMANCLNCTSGTDCLNCKTNFIFSGTCICDSLFYYNSANTQCQLCSSVMLGCSLCNTQTIPTPTTCSACQNGYYPSGIANPYCTKCDNLCDICTGTNACTDCSNNLQIDNSTGDCVCNYTNSQFLHPVTNFCLVCNQIITNCFVCNVLTDVTCLQCNDQYYPDPTAKYCLSCPLNCLNCTNQTYCEACEPGYTLVSNLCICDTSCQICFNATLGLCSSCDAMNTSICLECTPGYFNNSGLCEVCQSSSLPYCLQCADGSSCLTCRLPFIMVGIGLCDCNNTNSLFITNDVSQTCLPCSQVITNCTNCQNNATNYHTICLSCPDTLYLDNNICNPCMQPCVNCNVTAINCISCHPTFQVQNETCLCRNDLMMFFDTIIQGCRLCSQIYELCNNCSSINSSATTCISCDGAYFFNQATLKCQPCPSSCSNCLNLATCTQCINGFVVVNLQCVCNDSAIPAEYLSPLSNTCLKCEQIISGCTNCSFISILSCNQCLNSTYLDNNMCNPCPISCSTCNSIQCLSCPAGTTLDDGDCVCEDACHQCASLSLNCIQCNITNSTVTDCQSCLAGSYSSGPDCLSCSITCATCTSSTICLTCRSNFVISSTGMCQCLSSQGLFQSESQCKMCGDILYQCTQCDVDSNSAIICTSCSEGYFISLDNCLVCLANCLTCETTATNCKSCKDGLTLLNGTCTCDTNCLTCNTDSNSLLCVDCLYDIFGNFLQCQQCAGGSYLNNTICFTCPLDCVTCDENAICTSCKDTYEVINKSCSCNAEKNFFQSSSICVKCDSVFSFCQACTANLSNTAYNFSCLQCLVGYYILNETCVASVCADGFVTSGEQCDDNNTNDGDGCNKFCLKQLFFDCIGQPSVCTPNINFQLTLNEIKVDPVTCNQVTVSFTLDPIAQSYKTANFSNMLNYIKSLQVDYSNWLSWSYSQGVVSYTFIYQQNLQNRVVQFFFAPDNLNIIQTKKMPVIVIPVDFTSTNNIPAFLVQNSICTEKQFFQTAANVVEYTSYATMVLSAIPCKIVGLQLFGVLQLAHLSTGNIDNVNTMMTPLMGMKGVHGPNIKLDNNQQGGATIRRLQSGGSLTPNRVKSIGYSSNFLRNCNLMFLITTSLMVVSFSLFLVIELCKTCAPLCYSLMSRIAKELLLTLILFNCYNFAYSVGIHYRYASSDDSLYALGTLTATLTLIFPIIMCIILAVAQEDGFGQFKKTLKEGVLEKSYFIITILYRTGMGLYVATMNQDEQSALIVIAISILFLLYNLVNLPFVKAYHNYRANICHVTQFICLFITLYYRSMTSSKQDIEVAASYTPVYVQYTCIMIAFLVSFIVMIYEVTMFIKQCLVSKKSRNQVIKQTEVDNDTIQVQKVKPTTQNDENANENNSHFHIDMDLMKEIQNL